MQIPAGVLAESVPAPPLFDRREADSPIVIGLGFQIGMALRWPPGSAGDCRRGSSSGQGTR